MPLPVTVVGAFARISKQHTLKRDSPRSSRCCSQLLSRRARSYEHPTFDIENGRVASFFRAVMVCGASPHYTGNSLVASGPGRPHRSFDMQTSKPLHLAPDLYEPNRCSALLANPSRWREGGRRILFLFFEIARCRPGKLTLALLLRWRAFTRLSQRSLISTHVRSPIWKCPWPSDRYPPSRGT